MDPHHPFLHDEVADKLPELPDLAETYHKLVRELLYLAVCTRLDICNTVQRLSQHLSCPTPHLLTAAKHLPCYLTGTINLCLHYSPSSNAGELYGFSNTNWASNPEDQISISGHCWFFYGGMVSHMSKKQHTQVLSSTEAEYMVMSAAIQEGLWL
ncbi:hypothetical protein ID866_5611 [Astraeus odoratus]|nr:hypothetical protein ID866_5611 [Astraeus odoratus]